MQNNNPLPDYGYRINVNKPPYDELYLRFKKSKNIPSWCPCSDSERLEFEACIFEAAAKAKMKRAKAKRKYIVYAARHLDTEEPEKEVVHDRIVVGETVAVSKAQAINNVRYREMGNVSQYLPIETSGHWDLYNDWEAEECTTTN